MEFGVITLWGLKNRSTSYEGFACESVFFYCPVPEHDHGVMIHFRTPANGGGVSHIHGDKYKNIWTGVYTSASAIAVSPSILSYRTINPDVVDFHCGIPTHFKLVDEWEEFDKLPKGKI